MGPDDRVARVARAHAALDRAARAGSPVAAPTEDEAVWAVRRWESFERRRPRFSGFERSARINDLATGYAQRWDGSVAAAGSTMLDFVWLASVVCDALRFILPESCTVATGLADRARSRGQEGLQGMAAAAGLTVGEWIEIEGSYDACQLVGQAPVWLLMHRAVPVFAFSYGRPGEGPLGLVDPPFELGRLISVDWRWLGSAQSAEPLSPSLMVDLDRDDRDRLARRGAGTLTEALFHSN